MSMTVTSTAFAAGEPIPTTYSCKGDNTSPPLAWTGVPASAAELAIVVLDPDARNYVHWVVRGIDPRATSTPEGGTPPGAVVITRYAGPCPPSGTHHYEFTVYALGRRLDIGPGTKSAEAIGTIQKAASAQGRIVGTFAHGG
jgi:Raf kinase inhibitor-like YbhB/YbcL family protein